jgi:hypothetical protein
MSEPYIIHRASLPISDWWWIAAAAAIQARRRAPQGVTWRDDFTDDGYRIDGYTESQDFAVLSIIFAKQGNGTRITMFELPAWAGFWRPIFEEEVNPLELRAHDIRRTAEPSAEEVIERYYRSRAQGSRITLRQLAEETGFSYSYLRTVKAAYDAAGGWGSKSKKLQGRAGTKVIE